MLSSEKQTLIKRFSNIMKIQNLISTLLTTLFPVNVILFKKSHFLEKVGFIEFDTQFKAYEPIDFYKEKLICFILAKVASYDELSGNIISR